MNIIQQYRHGSRPVRYAVQRDPLRGQMHQIRDRFFDAVHLDSIWFTDEQEDSVGAKTQWRPRVDVREEADGFVIHADLPGVDPAAIEVQMDKGILSIRAERAIGQPVASSEEGGSEESSRQDQRYARQERQSGVFHRQFALPDSADAEHITAHGYNGVLEVRIPKKPETTPRRIDVAGTAPTVQ